MQKFAVTLTVLNMLTTFLRCSWRHSNHIPQKITYYVAAITRFIVLPLQDCKLNTFLLLTVKKDIRTPGWKISSLNVEKNPDRIHRINHWALGVGNFEDEYVRVEINHYYNLMSSKGKISGHDVQ